MKYQLLLAIVMVSTVQADEVQFKDQVSEHLITKAIKVNIAEVGAEKTAVDVKLGMTLDITEFDEKLMQPCINMSGIEVKKHRNQASTSYNKLVKGDSASLFAINGSLDVSIPLSVAEINGKANMDIANKSAESSAVSTVRIVEQLYDEEIDISALDPSKIQTSDICKKFTHVVTKVYRGKRYEAMLKLTDTSDNKSLSAGGELGVKLQAVPISGSGSMKVDWNDGSHKFNFTATIKTDGGPACASVSNLEDFYKYSTCWFDAAYNSNKKSSENMGPATRRMKSSKRRMFSSKRRLQLPQKDLKVEPRSDINCDKVKEYEGFNKENFEGDNTAIIGYELTPIMAQSNFSEHQFKQSDIDELDLQQAKEKYNGLRIAYGGMNSMKNKLVCAEDKTLMFNTQGEISKQISKNKKKQKEQRATSKTGAPDLDIIDAAEELRIEAFYISPAFTTAKNLIQACKRRRLIDQIRALKRRLRYNL